MINLPLELDSSPRCPVCGERLLVRTYHVSEAGEIRKQFKDCPFGCYRTRFENGIHMFFVGGKFVGLYHWTADAAAMTKVQRELWSEIRWERWRRLWWVLPVRALRWLWWRVRGATTMRDKAKAVTVLQSMVLMVALASLTNAHWGKYAATAFTMGFTAGWIARELAALFDKKEEP